MGINIIGAQKRYGEVVAIRGVGEMLGFQAYCAMLGVANPIMAYKAAIKEVARVNLHSWLCAKNF